jgi:hypothetical protein
MELTHPKNRNRELRLAPELWLSGPLLVPRVSSKAFPTVEKGLSAGEALDVVSEYITEALLVSAYDLHHHNLPDWDRLLGSEHNKSIYAMLSLLIVDSGSHELDPAGVEDDGTPGQDGRENFSREDFEAIVDQLPHDKKLLVVSYVNPGPRQPTYKEQRQAAQDFFESRRHLGSDFLLRAEKDELLLDVDELTPVAKDLSLFKVIGVTQQELGTSLLDRLVTVARLRELLDKQYGAEVPIHVFGSLDPILTPLYFMAGAEIFDGLGWLQYGYLDGLAIPPDQWSALYDGLLTKQQQTLDATRHIENLHAISDLKERLDRWAQQPTRYDHLGPRHKKLRAIYDTLRARLAQKR